MLCIWRLGNTDSGKRKRKTEEEEQVAYILDVLRSGERVLYLRKDLKFEASHCRLGTYADETDSRAVYSFLLSVCFEGRN
jgi:ssDNA-binding replication factor A large subunit